MANGNNFYSLAKTVAGMACLAALAYLGENGKDGGFIKDIWAAAKTASPFAAMFAILAWLDERRERKKAQEECSERTISFVEATNAQSHSLEKLVQAMKGISGAISSRLIAKAEAKAKGKSR